MNRAIPEKLLDYIDARIEEQTAGESSDAGLSESIWAGRIREELFELVDEEARKK